VGDAAGTVGVVLGAADEDREAAEVVRLEILGRERDEFAAAAEVVEADGNQDPVAEADEVVAAGGQ
jgi:hypothetical protein